MEGHVIELGVVLAIAIAIDALMVVFFWRYIARLGAQYRESATHYSASGLSFDDDDDDDDFDATTPGGYSHLGGYSHGLLTNPATGLPMLDGCIDVAGNPYGSDFSRGFELGGCNPVFDGLPWSSFDSGCGGLHDG
jgi:hypothetical protein